MLAASKAVWADFTLDRICRLFLENMGVSTN